MIANEDHAVVEHVFGQARALARDIAITAGDPPEFAEWLEILRDESRANSLEWEDTLHAVTDYFGLSRDTRRDDRSERGRPVET